MKGKCDASIGGLHSGGQNITDLHKVLSRMHVEMIS